MNIIHKREMSSEKNLRLAENISPRAMSTRRDKKYKRWSECRNRAPDVYIKRPMHKYSSCNITKTKLTK
jgi:hypothetical protein